MASTVAKNNTDNKTKPQRQAYETLLENISTPHDFRHFSDEQLKTLSSELRAKTIEAVSKTGGHLGAGLGVVELTVAIHAIFDTPKDRLIFDVGHQCYPHKILTGRKDTIETLRQKDGLSGFTKRSESEYDPFGAAHASTAMSAGLGMAAARDLSGDDNNVICVVGDGAMSAGMAYEAMNNAGAQVINGKKSRLIVILNDNEMSIAPPVGALSHYLTEMISSRPYLGVRDAAKQITRLLPPPLRRVAARAEENARAALGEGTLFEALGFYYIGPVDGHNLDHLLPILRNVRDNHHDGPILIHAITQKGKGYIPAESSADKMHGVAKFDIVSGDQFKPAATTLPYTKVFAKSLIEHARVDDKIVGITGAMPSGTGVDLFGYEFPDRTFDVGIAEQHAVTFAGGMATEGYKPFAAIYSTFLQRGYDQVVHDIALQNLPVRFAIDRAGLVGADGQTHAGSFDIAYLGCLPNMMIMAAGDELDLMHMVATAVDYNEGPCAFRYPRGEGIGLELPLMGEPLEIGKGRIIKDGNDIAILNFGGRLEECKKAVSELKDNHNISVTLADARFAKPLDTDLIDQLVNNHAGIITIEEGSRGGFGSMVLEYLASSGKLDKGIKIRNMILPDMFQDQAKPYEQYDEAGLNAPHIVNLARSLKI